MTRTDTHTPAPPPVRRRGAESALLARHMKDRLVLANWIRSGATLGEVTEASRFGMVDNERYTERAVRLYEKLWIWSAPRFSDPACNLQYRFRLAHGQAGLQRRFDRVLRTIEALKQ